MNYVFSARMAVTLVFFDHPGDIIHDRLCLTWESNPYRCGRILNGRIDLMHQSYVNTAP